MAPVARGSVERFDLGTVMSGSPFQAADGSLFVSIKGSSFSAPLPFADQAHPSSVRPV